MCNSLLFHTFITILSLFITLRDGKDDNIKDRMGYGAVIKGSGNGYQS